MLRSIAPGMSPSVVQEVDAKLASLRQHHRVATPLAIESGSRAWGFPSPDSDYDCRFVFVRSIGDYLTPWPRRDVIELPLKGEFDINGWELGKALKLMLKGNAVILEWLQSPIIYEADGSFRDEFLDLARRHADRGRIARHYLHLGEGQWATYFGGGAIDVPLKKMFYVLRPAAALRWMALHPEQQVPPMNFIELMDQSDLGHGLRSFLDDLLARKAVTRELGSAPVPTLLADFVNTEYAAARAGLSAREKAPSPVAYAEAEAFFRRCIERFATS